MVRSLPRFVVAHRWRFAQLGVVTLAVLPAVLLIHAAMVNTLGANPVEALERRSGDWALRFLLLTLAMTPLRILTGKGFWLRFRRTFGLAAFGYVLMHFLVYFVIDRGLLWSEIVTDIIKRPYITLGFLCFVLLVPLALTSTQAMIRRLGARRWRALHRLVYIITAGGVLHYWWLVKADLREPLLYTVIFVALMLVRVTQLRLAMSRAFSRLWPIIGFHLR